MSRTADVWAFVLRISVGGFWLYFASQRWFDISWVRELFTTAAYNNYTPLYGDLLRGLVDSWLIIAYGVTAAETVIGLMLVLGIYPRLAGGAGAFIAANLLLTFSFCTCPWNAADAPMVFWFYFAAVILNLAVLRESHQIQILRRRTSHKRS